MVKPSDKNAVVFKTCPLCEAMCGLRIEVENGSVQSIRGDCDDPFSRGHVCPKAVALTDIHTDPDRLQRPMLRNAHGWKEISWSEALDLAARGLHQVQKKNGRSSVAVYLGNPTVHNLGAMLFVPIFLRSFGSRSVFSATSVDQLPHMVAAQQMFGHRMLVPVPDLDRTDFLLILGANPVASNGSMMTAPDVARRLRAIRDRGGRIVVVDPRKTETAQASDEHVFIRPGTDALLLLAMLRIVLGEGAEIGPLADLCDGLEDLRDLAGDVDLELCATCTGIELPTIRRLASQLMEAPRAACYGRMGASTQAFGGLCQWLVTTLNTVTGNLDREGGAMFTEPAFDLVRGPRAFALGRGRLAQRVSRVRALPDFASELPVAALAEEMLEPGEGQIRGFVCFAGNPVLSTPNGSQLERGLQSLDFMISVDPYLNETSRHANLILPPTSPLEREHFDIAFHSLAIRNTAKYSPPVFEPSPDAQHDWQILHELQQRVVDLRAGKRLKNRVMANMLRRMGPAGLLDLGLRFGPRGPGLNPFSNGLTLKRLRRQPHGVDLGPLQSCLRNRLPSAHPRINLTPKACVDDVKRLWQTFRDQPGSFANSRLLLIGRRHVRDNNSWMHNTRRLMRGSPRCTLFMHPVDAGRLDLSDGDEATVRSRTGQVCVRVTVTDDVMPGVVSLPHGYGHSRPGIRLSVAEQHAGASINDLTDDQAVDELTGNAVLNGTPVSVSPVA